MNLPELPPLRRSGTRAILAFAIWGLCAISTPARADDPPAHLKFLTATDPANGVSLSLDSITYTNKTAGMLAGSGTLTLTIGGTSLQDPSTTTFEGVSADATGKATGLTYTFKDDKKIADLFGSGLGLSIGKSTTLKVQSRGTADLSGGFVAILLPFRDDSGSRPGLKFTPNISLKENGDLVLDATQAELTSDTKARGLTMAGFTVDAAPMNLHYAHHANKADEWSFNVPTASISTGLPGMTSTRDAPLKLTVSPDPNDPKDKGLVVDQDGMVSFKHAVLTTKGLTIPLAQPMGFTLTIQDAALTMSASQPTSFDLTADLTLPPDISSQKGGGGDAVTIKGIKVHAASGDGPLASIDGPLDMYWNGFGLHVPAGKDQIVVDLSALRSDPAEKDVTGAALDASWQGLYLKSTTIELPDGFSDQNNGSASVKAQGVYVNEHGVSGKIDIGPGSPDQNAIAQLKLMGFTANLTDLHLTFKRNSVQDCSIKGGVTVPGWGGTIGLNAAVSSAGLVSVDVQTDKPISIDAFQADAQLTNGSFQMQPDSSTRLMLTGTFAFRDSAPSEIAGAALDFKDVGIGSDGHFYLGNNWITLPHPVQINLGVIGLEVSQIGFGQEPATGDAYSAQYGNRFWVGMTGDVSLSGDLPITGQVSFDGLRIFAPGQGSNKPDIAVGDVAIDTDIQDVIHVSGGLQHNAGLPLSDGTTVPYMQGNINLSLSCLGAGGIGGGLDLLIAPGAWFIMGNVTFPPIPVGQTGLALMGFAGGIGHNVKPDKEGATGVPTIDYKLVPDVAAIKAGGAGTYVFVAGVRAGSTAPYTLWGDLVLTLYLPNVDIDLNGKCYLLSDAAGKPMPQDPMNEDRVLAGDIHFDAAAKTFTAGLTADLNFPTRQSALLHAGGNLELCISPDPPTGQGKFIHIGGPISTNPLAIQNPCEIQIANLSPLQGALDLDISPQSQLTAALIYDQSFSNSGNFDIVNWSVSGDVNLQGYAVLDFHTMDGNAYFHAVGSGSVSGGVDLGWAGSYDASAKLTVEGDLYGNLHSSSSPRTLSAGGTVSGTATMSFPIYGDASFGISSGVNWSTTL